MYCRGSRGFIVEDPVLYIIEGVEGVLQIRSGVYCRGCRGCIVEGPVCIVKGVEGVL